MSASKIALLIIGQEILSGKITDANTPYAAKLFYEKGITLAKVEYVPDDIDEIACAVKELSEKYDYLITSGGIGPTHDDVTMEGIAKALGQKIIKHNYLETTLIRHYKGAVLTAAQGRMAIVPEKAEILVPTTYDEDYFLPQVYVGNIYIMPGVPKSFAHYLNQIIHLFSGQPLLHDEISIKGIETKLTAALNRSVHKFPTVRFGSYPSFEPSNPDSFIVEITMESLEAETLKEAREFLIQQLPKDMKVLDKEI